LPWAWQPTYSSQLVEVIDGVIKVIDDPNVTLDELMKIIKGPDFPTAGIIVGKQGIRDAYATGKGKIIVRAVATIEQMPGNKQRIVVTELPYQVNKAKLIERIAELVKEKRIDSISDLRDESDKDGMRIVIELKKDANANVVLNQLYKNTQMQDAFNVTWWLLYSITRKSLSRGFLIKTGDRLLHQASRGCIVRRTKFDLDKAEARAHILEGLRLP